MTTLWAGGLAVEVYEYHRIVNVARAHWAVVPQVSAPLLAFAAFLALTWPKRGAIVLLVVACGISIVVGLVGPVLHYGYRGLSLSAAPVPGSWLGDPPPLAPLEFTVVGLLGLVPVSWRNGRAFIVAPTGRIAATCEGAAALLCLLAAGFAITLAPVPAKILVWAALGIGTLGYLSELTSKPVPVTITLGVLAVVGVLGVAYLRAHTAVPPAAAPVSTAGGSTVALGMQQFQANGCAGCHVVGGASGAGGANGPNLTHVGAVRTQAQLEQAIVKGVGTMPAYPNLTPAQLNALIDYLQSLK